MIYRFDDFEADDDASRLTTDGAAMPLEPKALRLLLYLIERRGRLVRKQELLDAVWSDAAVSESALTRAVGLLRKTLADDSREPRFIETVPTAGYRFIAQVEVVSAAHDSMGVPSGAPSPTPLPPQPVADRRKLLRTGLLGAACLVALAAATWLVASRHHSEPIRSLAVLPLANLSGDASEEYFADGMTDELITEIARIPNLHVVSRTSVMAYKDPHRSLQEIARQLNVDAIVEGSVVRSGSRVRITAQLIDARTDRHLWAQSFEGNASDVLSLQDNVAQQIAQQTRLVLLPGAARPPVNPAAHDAYLRGRYFLNKQDVSHSLESFEQAIAIDPGYASAYAGYATALDAAATFGIGRPEELMPKALAAAQRAIQLDPQNGEAYTALGSVQTIYSWDWAAAEQNLTRGIALNPNDALAEFKYAIYLDATGRPQDAVTHMRHAVELDPLSFFADRRLSATLYLARQYDAALAQMQRAQEMEHSPGSTDNYLSLIYEQRGDRDKAVEHDLIALHSYEPQLDMHGLLHEYQQHGWESYWRARARALIATPGRPCIAYQIGVSDLRVHDLDDAFSSFQRAIGSHCYSMVLIRVDPLFDTVRQDARYGELLKRMHL